MVHKSNRPWLTAEGREILDPTPMAPPVGYKRHPSLAEQIREMVRSERLAAEAAAAGYETFEEADDFDVDDDVDPNSKYEGDFDPIPFEELKAENERLKAELAGKGQSRGQERSDAPLDGPAPAPRSSAPSGSIPEGVPSGERP